MANYQYFYKHAKRGKYPIDGREVYCDSESEAKFIQKLTANGFSGKWSKSKRGIAYGLSRYTPDVELSVFHDEINVRALVEFKHSSITEFAPKRRIAMRAAAKFYSHAICLAYVGKLDQWYFIEPNGRAVKTMPPKPGVLLFNELPKPRLTIPIATSHGRWYATRPQTLFFKKTADGLEFIVKAFVYPSKNKKK